MTLKSASIALSLLLLPTTAALGEDAPPTDDGVAQADEGAGDEGSAMDDDRRGDRGDMRRRQRNPGGWYRNATLLPEEGDYALGFNAVPFLAYLGNAFNNSTYNAPSTQFTLGDQMVYGKYFLAPDTAIRARARISATSDVVRAAVVDDNQDPATFDPSDTVIDERYSRSASIALAGGLEKRRGHGRLQGFYGAEAGLGYAKNTVLYGYGNAIADDNTTPTTSTFTGGTYQPSSRTLESRPGATFSITARGFAGAEVFIAPRISVGGEFGYGIMAGFTTAGTTVSETYNVADQDDEVLTYDVPGGARFDMDTDNLSGSLFLMVHF